MNQAQHGITGVGSPLIVVTVGSKTQSVTQVAVNVGNVVTGVGSAVGYQIGITYVVELEDGCEVSPAPGSVTAYGHGAGWIIRGTGVPGILGYVLGVMRNGGGLILGDG